MTAQQQRSLEKLARNINIIKETYHISIKELAAELGHDKRTMSLRLKCPWLFNVEDLEHIAEIGGSATIETVYGSATIETVYDSATIVSSYTWSWTNVKKVAIADNATLVDRYNKTIYQAGDGWMFVKAEEEVTTTK